VGKQPHPGLLVSRRPASNNVVVAAVVVSQPEGLRDVYPHGAVRAGSACGPGSLHFSVAHALPAGGRHTPASQVHQVAELERAGWLGGRLGTWLSIVPACQGVTADNDSCASGNGAAGGAVAAGVYICRCGGVGWGGRRGGAGA